MDIYLVGGAVRDELLGLPVTERDWVVVGATPDELTRLGYKSVGKDFPVFLHPDTGEEYALARTERKTGKGHRGFDCDASTSVTLEDDLKRRDFTINAIARHPEGELIDPYGGLQDLENRVLRHMSSAFEEDPLRVVRAARFCAKLHHLGFELHPDTVSLLRRMVDRGDLAELPPERIFGELEKALQSPDPAVFFTQLQELGAGEILWAEIDQAGIDLLAGITKVSDDTVVRFAALLANLSGSEIETLCRRLKTPSKYREPALFVAQYYSSWKNVLQMDAEAIVDLLRDTDAFRRRERFVQISEICSLIQSLDDKTMAQQNHKTWMHYRDVADSVRADDIKGDIAGPALGEAIKERRIELIKKETGHA